MTRRTKLPEPVAKTSNGNRDSKEAEIMAESESTAIAMASRDYPRSALLILALAYRFWREAYTEALEVVPYIAEL